MKKHRLPWLIGLLVFVILAVAADTVLWRRALAQLDMRYLDAVDRLRASGLVVAADPPRTGGWPFAVDLTVPVFQITAADGSKFRSENTRAVLSLFTPWVVRLDLRGPHVLELSGFPALRLTGKRLTVWVSPAGGRGSFTGNDVTVDSNGAPLLRLATVNGSAVPQGDFLTLSARVESLEWLGADKLTDALGPRLSSLSIDADTTLLPSLGAPDMWAAWRARNGSVVVHRLAFGWGPFGFDGQMNLTLDASLHPLADGTAKLLGYPDTLNALARAGVLSANTALSARAALGLLAEASDSSTPQVTVPFGEQNGVVSIAGFPLFRLKKAE